MANDKKTLTPEEVVAKKEASEKAAKEKAELEAKAKADQEAQEAKELADEEAKELAEKEAAAKAAKDANEVSEGQQSSKYMQFMRKIANEYYKYYPHNKVFHITSDTQVFLKNGLSAAQVHQKTLNEGTVTTIILD